LAFVVEEGADFLVEFSSINFNGAAHSPESYDSLSAVPLEFTPASAVSSSRADSEMTIGLLGTATVGSIDSRMPSDFFIWPTKN
jgi:hypothetical protein